MVNPASLTVTASDATATYGQMPKVSAQYSAFLNGDSAASLTTAPTCTSTDNGTAPVSGSPYVSSCSGAVDSNYSFSYVTGSVTVGSRSSHGDRLQRYLQLRRSPAEHHGDLLRLRERGLGLQPYGPADLLDDGHEL